MVLGLLLLEGIHAYKAYTRYPGFDLIATDPGGSRLCKIQVKSRWATDYDHKFPMKKDVDCDFVILAELNRGKRGYIRKTLAVDIGQKPPRFFVFPAKTVNSRVKVSGGWSKVALADVPAAESYIDRWDQIRTFLRMPPVAPAATS